MSAGNFEINLTQLRMVIWVLIKSADLKKAKHSNNYDIIYGNILQISKFYFEKSDRNNGKGVMPYCKKITDVKHRGTVFILWG